MYQRIRTAVLIPLWLLCSSTAWSQATLIGHWPFQKNDAEASGLAQDARGTNFGPDISGPGGSLKTAGRFDGLNSEIQVDAIRGTRIGSSPFSIAAWVRIPDKLDDTPGDLMSLYDSGKQTGFTLGIRTQGGVTNSQPNDRQLHFGVDDGGPEEPVIDHGRLGNAVFVFALCVHNGRMYAATCHAGSQESGHVFRFDGDDRWTDLGSPDHANAITALSSYQGQLYVASGKYRLAGSSLTESENLNPGGRVFRLSENDEWVSCGRVSSETEAISSMIEYQGNLYAASLYKPAGFFRYRGGEDWEACSTPEGRRVEATIVFNGALYATCYDEGAVFRFNGDTWERVGTIPGATQTYGLAIFQSRLWVSEWPQAHVYRYREGTAWDDTGKLGNELEAMPLLVCNGRLYGGTLPTAEIYRYDGDLHWNRVAQVDLTPDVKYRRAWSMAMFQGRLFVGTLPSGRVKSLEAGRNVTWDHRFPSGWHHVAAVRSQDRLRLFLDGKQVAESRPLKSDFNIGSEANLTIGRGPQDHFHGDAADLRLYLGELSQADIQSLVNSVR